MAHAVPSQPDPQSEAEVERYLSQDEAALFAQMVSPGDQQAFSRDGMLMRGREIFYSVLGDVRSTVCEIYRGRKGKYENPIALGALIAGSLIGSAALAGIPVYAFAALAVKVGLERVCDEDGVDT